MRKLLKKVATVALTATMLTAISVSAFADEDDTYSFVGNPYLFNSEVFDDNSTLGWCPTSEEQIMEKVEVDGLDYDVYAYSNTAVKSGADALAESEGTEDEIAESKGQLSDKTMTFKILKNATDFAWNFQMQLGNPDAAWADNQSQFRAGGIEAGEYTVYAAPSKGFVAIIQDGKNVDMTVRFHSRDEDSWKYVDCTEAAITGDGYDASAIYTQPFDDEYLAFINALIAKDGGEAIEYVKGNEEKASSEDVTEAKDDKKTDSSSSDKKSTSSDSDDEGGISGGLIAGIVVAVVAVIAIIAVVVKKKED